MLRNYFKTAIRFLSKNKTFSFINIIGLAIGTLCCLYIVLYVKDQYSYDKHERNAKDIYRVTTWLSLPGDVHNNATCSPPIAPAMRMELPGVQQFTRVIGDFRNSRHLLRYKEKSIYETELHYVDSTFFDVFTYHFVSGNPANALNQPYSTVLLKTTADKLFGSEDPVGKVITIDDDNGKHDFTVMGTVDESLGKSIVQANIFVTMHSGGIGDYVMTSDAWAGNNFTNTFIKVVPNTNVTALQNKLPAFLQKHAAKQLRESGMTKVLRLQPLGVIHTTPGYEVEMSKTADPSFLNILVLIAVLIQVIACINFMNLSTARASKRAKEVGVRKVIGAERRDLIKQFMSESFVLSLLGVAIALPLLIVLLPYLNSVTQAHILPSMLTDYRIWLLLAGIILVTGIIAGSYPAFYLSAFQAIKVIKGNFTSHISAAGIRRTLVVFQFVLSTILIIGIIVIYSQLRFIQHKDLGFDKNQRLVFNFHTDESRGKVDALITDLRQLSEVKDISKANDFLGNFVPYDFGVFLAGGNQAAATDAQNISCDEHFVATNGIKIISGRDFHLYDSGKVLINETLMNRLGLKKENAPGTTLYASESSMIVAGVMKDFNYNSLHSDIKPFMLRYGLHRDDFSHVVVSVSGNNYTSLLAKMETIWHKVLPGVPFEYSFLDEEVQRQYTTEITLSRIINSFTIMAIFISCLGLFGLAAFSAEQRKKEIGVRKVLGASVPGIVQLLSSEFVKLVTISIVIATPVAWWAMHKWLQSFVYRVTINWWMFVLAAAIALGITFITVSFEAIKAAMANPAKSLRTE
jgi:putative ABC transport system permease protein